MKNTIKKVAILGNGSKGLKATITQFRTINNMYVPKELVEKQKVAVPSNLMSSFRKLRYYLLETTERIPQEWKDMSLFVNGEFDQGKKLVGDAAKRAWAECQDLLDRTLIDSVETTNTDGSLGYKIVGRIASKDSGYISNTESPLITDEHSTIFYREVADIVGTLFEQAVARWVGGAHDAEYAETWPAFRARGKAALATLLDALPQGSDALVFTSGGPIAALAQDLLHIPDSDGFRLNWGLVNCGVTKLVRGRDGLRLSTFNGHAHFEGEHASLVTYR